MRESSVQQRIRLLCSKHGILEQRNNVGVANFFNEETGKKSVVRYGLLNEDHEQNKKIKSSDLICIQPVVITPDMVGQTVGIYVSLETKESSWHLTPGDKHAQAQAAYHRLVIAHGGRAGFVTCEDDMRRLLRLI